MAKTTLIKARLHEQRERPTKGLVLLLKKGTIVEELDWDRKTETVKIHRRFFVEGHKRLKSANPRKALISVTLAKDDMGKSGKRKTALVSRVMRKHYPVLAYSFFDTLLSSTLTKYLMQEEFEREKFIKTITRIVNAGAKERTLKEVK